MTIVKLAPKISLRSDNKELSRSRVLEFERGGDLQGVSRADLNKQGGFFDIENGKGTQGIKSWRLSVVYRCVAVIAETMASMRFDLVEKLKGGMGTASAEGYRSYDLYATDPNEDQTWFDFFSALMVGTLNEGNGFALIKRNAFGYPVEFRTFTSGECTPYVIKNADATVSITYFIYGKAYPKSDVIHIKTIGDGYVGESILAMARKAVEGGLSQQEFNENIYANGLNLQGTLEAPFALSEEAVKRLKESMQDFRGAKKSNGTLLLEEGVKYTKMSVNPIDAQFVESRRFTIEELCRFYGVPLNKVMNADKSNVQNQEQQDLGFYKDCIVPWITRVEAEFNRKVLTTKERRKFAHRFDTSALLRGDFKARAEFYNALFPKGAISPDEIRVRENMNATGNEATTKHYMQLAMSDIEKLDENRQHQNPNGGTNEKGTNTLAKTAKDNQKEA